MRITIINRQARVPVNSKNLRRAIRNFLLAQKKNASLQITVCVVTDAVIAGLNAKYLGETSPTDVIAFETGFDSRSKILIGDIAVSGDAACRNAYVYGTSPSYELFLYALHGVLHLLGYEDKTARQSRRMQKICETFLKEIRVNRVHS